MNGRMYKALPRTRILIQSPHEQVRKQTNAGKDKRSELYGKKLLNVK